MYAISWYFSRSVLLKLLVFVQLKRAFGMICSFQKLESAVCMVTAHFCESFNENKGFHSVSHLFDRLALPTT